MSNRSRPFKIWFMVGVAVILTAFVIISFVAREAEWLARGGALIEAFSAVAIYYQIKAEIDIETERQKLEAEPGAVANIQYDSTIDKKVKQIVDRRKRRVTSKLTSDRLQIVAVIVLYTCIGELLHGFGYLILNTLFPDYFKKL